MRLQGRAEGLAHSECYANIERLFSVGFSDGSGGKRICLRVGYGMENQIFSSLT